VKFHYCSSTSALHLNYVITVQKYLLLLLHS